MMAMINAQTESAGVAQTVGYVGLTPLGVCPTCGKCPTCGAQQAGQAGLHPLPYYPQGWPWTPTSPMWTTNKNVANDSHTVVCG